MRKSKGLLETWKCIDCGLDQSIDLFPKYEKATGEKSISSRCIDCKKKRSAVVRTQERERNRQKKECPTCRITQPLSHFILGRGVLADETNQCRDCIVSQFREVCPEWLKDTYSPIQRLSNVKKLYGLDPEEYIDLMKNSTNCEICNVSLDGKVKCIDHSHETGKNRGIICHSCNMAMGKLKDNPETLLRAITYLTKFSNPLVLSSNGTSDE